VHNRLLRRGDRKKGKRSLELKDQQPGQQRQRMRKSTQLIPCATRNWLARNDRRALRCSVQVTPLLRRGREPTPTCPDFAPLLRVLAKYRARAPPTPRPGLRLAVDANGCAGLIPTVNASDRGGQQRVLFEVLCEKPARARWKRTLATRLQVWPRVTRMCLLLPLNRSPSRVQSRPSPLGQGRLRASCAALKAEGYLDAKGGHYSPVPSRTILYFQLPGTSGIPTAWKTRSCDKLRSFMFAGRIRMRANRATCPTTNA